MVLLYGCFYDNSYMIGVARFILLSGQTEDDLFLVVTLYRRSAVCNSLMIYNV